MLFFSEHGFPMSEFLRLKMGPVVDKDEIEYFREVHLLKQVRVTLCAAGLASDGGRWLLRDEFFRTDRRLAARVTSTGGLARFGGPKARCTPGQAAGGWRFLAAPPQPLPTWCGH
jgi:acyl-CoA thioester hydrolase